MKIDIKERIIIPLCKVDYIGVGKKCNLIEISVDLYSGYGQWRKAGEEYFSIMGYIWNNKKSDCYSCGQNFDTIARYLYQFDEDTKKLYLELMEYHEKYNLCYTNTIPKNDIKKIEDICNSLLEIWNKKHKSKAK